MMGIINYLFLSLPEAFILVLWGTVLFGYQLKDVYSKVLLIAFLLAFFSDLMWILNILPDLRILITYSLTILFYRFLLKENWLRSVIMFIGSFFTLILTEGLVIFAVSPFASLEMIVNNFYLKVIVTYLYLFPLLIGIIAFSKKRWSLNGIFQKREISNNKFHFYWMLIIVASLSQFFLIVYLNYAFYIEKMRIVEKQILLKVSGIPLISILLLLFNVILIFYIIRYKNYQHNIELNQFEHSYQENLQGLIHTLKAERHDYINDIQVLYGMSQEKMHDYLHEYLQHLVVNITKINRAISLKNIPVSAYLHSKFSELESKNIELRLKVETNDTFPTIKGYDLVKIVSNIVDNAIRAITEVQLDDPYIELIWSKEEDRAIITISNNGPKIENKKIELLFKEGYTSKTENSNSGYGLSIVKKSVDKYNGRIKVISTQERTSFIINIPL